MSMCHGCRPGRELCSFFQEHRGQPLPSAALMSPISRSFVAKLEGFVAQHEIPLVQFRRGQRKDAVMTEHLRHFRHDERRQGSGEDACVPYREAPEPDDRPAISLDREVDRNGEPLLRLTRWTATSAR